MDSLSLLYLIQAIPNNTARTLHSAHRTQESMSFWGHRIRVQKPVNEANLVMNLPGTYLWYIPPGLQEL